MQVHADRSPSADRRAPAGVVGREGGESVGRYLSRQRRLRDIGLQELSDITKIPVRSLERLESGHFDGEIDGFVRGFVRTVAEGLGLDPDDTLARMLDEVRVEEGARPRMRPGAQRALVLGVAALVGLLLIGTVRAVWVAGMSRAAAPADERVYWRDPVRALAEAADASSPREVSPSAPANDTGAARDNAAVARRDEARLP